MKIIINLKKQVIPIHIRVLRVYMYIYCDAG